MGWRGVEDKGARGEANLYQRGKTMLLLPSPYVDIGREKRGQERMVIKEMKIFYIK